MAAEWKAAAKLSEELYIETGDIYYFIDSNDKFDNYLERLNWAYEDSCL